MGLRTIAASAILHSFALAFAVAISGCGQTATPPAGEAATTNGDAQDQGGPAEQGGQDNLYSSSDSLEAPLAPPEGDGGGDLGRLTASLTAEDAEASARGDIGVGSGRTSDGRPRPRPSNATFSPSSGAPGSAVTLSGTAQPNTFMSVYFYCDAGCGETHVGVAKVNARGAYSLTFQIPQQARAGAAYVMAGCDTCGNGWKPIRGLNVVSPAPQATIDPQTQQAVVRINDSYVKVFGRGPSDAERNWWLGVVLGNASLNNVDTLVDNHRRYLKANARTTFGVDVVKRAFKQATGRDPNEGELAPWLDQVAEAGLVYPELTSRISERRTMVLASYQRAFGRDPSADEVRYWLGVPGGDARIASLDALIKNHQQFARANAEGPFGRDMVARAFKEATGIEYKPDDYSQLTANLVRYPLKGLFESATEQLKKDGTLYKDLVWSTRVSGAFRLAYGRAPTATELAYWKSVFGIICDVDCEAQFLKAWNFGKVLEELREHLRDNVNGQPGVEVLERAMREGLQVPYIHYLDSGSTLNQWQGNTWQETLKALQRDVADGRVLDFYDILLDVWVRKAYLDEYGSQPSLEELAYWLGLPRSDPRLQGRGLILNTLRDIKWQATVYVREAHVHVMGSYPNSSEEAYWVGKFRNRSVSSVSQVIEEMRQELRANDQLTRTVVGRAYENVYDWQPGRYPYTPSYSGFRGWSYTEIAETLARDLIRFTYNELVQSTPAPQTEQQYVELMLYGGLSPADLWDQVATSQERLDKFGYYAPSRKSYRVYPDSPGNPRRDKKEQCFGDIGPGECKGVADKAFWMPAPRRTEFQTPDGRKMFYIESPTAVGSILHDVACSQALERGQVGAWCNGLEQGAFWELRALADLAGAAGGAIAATSLGGPWGLLALVPLGKVWSELVGKASFPASLEWNKAVWNTVQGRWWWARYGPYSDPLTEWSDDLTPANPRPALMAPLVFGFGWFDQTMPYGGIESRSTRALKAPPRTYMDVTDAAFCESGSFSRVDNWVIGKWGHCR